MKKFFLILHLKASIKKKSHQCETIPDIIFLLPFSGRVYYFRNSLMSLIFLEELSLWLSIVALPTFRQIKGSSHYSEWIPKSSDVSICIWVLQL